MFVILREITQLLFLTLIYVAESPLPVTEDNRGNDMQRERYERGIVEIGLSEIASRKALMGLTDVAKIKSL